MKAKDIKLILDGKYIGFDKNNKPCIYFEMIDGVLFTIGGDDTDNYYGYDIEDDMFYSYCNFELITKPVETTKEQPKDSLTFNKEDLKPLYHLLSRTTSRKYMDELETYLERLAFMIG